MKLTRLKYLLLLLFVFSLSEAFSQTEEEEVKPPSTAEEYQAQYEQNIRKSRINGVYIPVDINDAISELIKLSPPESLEKFKNADENLVVKKLHYGLGGWITYKWNLYEGSRIENYLRKMGLGHPDDMVDFIVTCLHRHLNNKNLETEELVKFYKDRRLKEIQKRFENRQVTDSLMINK